MILALVDDAGLVAATGLDTGELVARVTALDVSPLTLDALRLTADGLCCAYPYAKSVQLEVECRVWLRRITRLLDRRMAAARRRDVLGLAGSVALLVGCVEYDQGRRAEAEATRRLAHSFGAESGRADVVGWAHEMRAWFLLTQGDYRGAAAAADTGLGVAPRQSVAVQLAAHQAKACARMRDRRQTEVALNSGRELLEALPQPEDLDHHFVIDPAKFDLYAMDCYRILGDDQLASRCADAVIRVSTDGDGVLCKPMRVAEAHITLGVAAARDGDLTGAVSMGWLALTSVRKSLPSLAMVVGELTAVLAEAYPNEVEARDFITDVRALAA